MSGDGQDYDKDNVNLWVDSSRKARWESYIEDSSDIQYMSQLVRRSVENEITDDDPGEVTIPDRLEKQLDEAIERLQDFQRQVERFDDRLISIEQAVRENPDVRDLANRIFEALPTEDERQEYEQLVRQAGSKPPDTVEPAIHSGRITDIAGHLEEPEQRVRQALQKLQQDTYRVHVTEHDDELRYYKEA